MVILCHVKGCKERCERTVEALLSSEGFFIFVTLPDFKISFQIKLEIVMVLAYKVSWNIKISQIIAIFSLEKNNIHGCFTLIDEVQFY